MGTKKHEIYTAASFFSYFYRSRSLVRLISSFNSQSEPERIFAVSVSDFILRFFLQLIIGCGDVICTSGRTSGLIWDRSFWLIISEGLIHCFQLGEWGGRRVE